MSLPIDSPGRARLLWAQRRIAGDASLAVVDELVPEGGLVVDAGADWGLFTARMSQLVGADGTVHAFEPNPVSRTFLHEIAGVEANVVVHEAALSDRSGSALLHVPVENGARVHPMGSLAPRDGATCDTVRVTTARLDDVLGSVAGRVSFIKCDVEGHELQVLAGAARTLDEARPTLLVEIERRHAQGRMEETFAFLEEHGYDCRAIGPAGPMPIHDFDLERDQLAYLSDRFETGEMPRGYVHDFLFTPRRA